MHRKKIVIALLSITTYSCRMRYVASTAYAAILNEMELVASGWGGHYMGQNKFRDTQRKWRRWSHVHVRSANTFAHIQTHARASNIVLRMCTVSPRCYYRRSSSGFDPLVPDWGLRRLYVQYCNSVNCIAQG